MKIYRHKEDGFIFEAKEGSMQDRALANDENYELIEVEKEEAKKKTKK